MECLRLAYLQVVTELLGEDIMVPGGRLESQMLNSVTKIREGFVAFNSLTNITAPRPSTPCPRSAISFLWSRS
jgi:hypothetical protein